MDATRRLTVALFAGGIATFSELYTTQAVLPELAAQWQLSPSSAALSVSVVTGALAVSVLPWAAVADRIGRGRSMRISAIVTAVMGLLLPASPSFEVLLVLRAVSGLALGALPALAIAHLIELNRSGRAAAVGGIYIAGTTIGGLSGRLLTGTVGGAWGWRWGVAATGVLAAVAAVVFVVLLPPGEVASTSQNGRRSPERSRRRIRLALSDRQVWVFYLQGFLLMGAFITVYNLLGFRLAGDPYRLPTSVTSLLFLSYLTGTVGSSAVGRMVGRWGRRPVLIAAGLGMAGGALLCLAPQLGLIIAGLIVITFCFFVAHALAASWAAEQLPQARSQATAVYSLGYYAGSSILGFTGALVYARAGWTWAIVMIAALAAVAATVAALGAPRQADGRRVRV